MGAKLVAHLLATAAPGSNPDISQKEKWATEKKEWPTHSSPPKKYTKTIRGSILASHDAVESEGRQMKHAVLD